MKKNKTLKQNSLFQGDPSRIRFNACVGKNGGPYDFYDYGNGYFKATKRLVESLEERTNRNPVDIMVYPIGYLFRHGIELNLKYFADVLPHLLSEKKALKFTHKLEDNFKLVKTYFIRIPYISLDELKIERAEKILREFLEIDPSGEVFRFPKNKKGKSHLQNTTLINLLVLGEAMEELMEIFEYWFYCTDTLLEIKVNNNE